MPFTYDKGGNIESNGTKDYTHDAWNRLVRVEFSGSPATTVGLYEYNALHWRVKKEADTSTVPDGLDRKVVMYYDAAWRLIEERIDENYVSSPGDNFVAEQFWGQRYIDDAVLRRRFDLNPQTEADWAPYFYATDAQFSVRRLLSNGAKLVESVDYEAYGTARHHYHGDVDMDGDVDSTDQSGLSAIAALTPGIGTTYYIAEMDLNRDGTIDSADVSLQGGTKTALPTGWISDPIGADNPIGFDGYVFSLEVDHYSVRFRWYDPVIGRWLERDPAGYTDGMNSVAFVRSMPTSGRDSLGLEDDLPGERKTRYWDTYSGWDKRHFLCTPEYAMDTQIDDFVQTHAEKNGITERAARCILCQRYHRKIRQLANQQANLAEATLRRGCNFASSSGPGSMRPLLDAKGAVIGYIVGRTTMSAEIFAQAIDICKSGETGKLTKIVGRGSLGLSIVIAGIDAGCKACDGEYLDAATSAALSTGSIAGGALAGRWAGLRLGASCGAAGGIIGVVLGATGGVLVGIGAEAGGNAWANSIEAGYQDKVAKGNEQHCAYLGRKMNQTANELNCYNSWRMKACKVPCSTGCGE